MLTILDFLHALTLGRLAATGFAIGIVTVLFIVWRWSGKSGREKGKVIDIESWDAIEDRFADREN